MSLRCLRGLAPFSLRLLATDLIASIYNNVAQLFIAKIYSTAELGFYAQAQKLKELPVTSTVQAVQGVTYPALSSLKEDEQKFCAGYERIVSMVAFVIFPVMLGLVAIAEDMFMLLLGQKWMATVPYFEILALAGLFYPLAMVSYNVLKVRSDGRVIVRLELVKRIVMTVVLCVAIPRGVVAVAWGMTAMALVEFLLNTLMALRYVSLGVVRLVRALMPSLLLAVAMYLALEVLNPYVEHLHIALRLLVDTLGGALLYILLAWLLRLAQLKEVWRLLGSMLAKSE